MRRLSFLIVIFLINNVYSADLATRQKQFKQIIEKTPEIGQIKKAESIAKDKKSPYRIDAINYLIDQMARSSGPMMADLTKDPEIREFAIYGVGELRIAEATPLLIYYLKDPSHNVRGNAFRALEKIYPHEFNFNYRYDDSSIQRAQKVKEIEQWWELNKETLKNRDIQTMSQVEQKEALDRWEKYGKEYLNRIH